MLLNGLSPVIMPNDLSEITDGVDSLIAPDGYAFSIWGLIYSLLGVFTVYSALPSAWVPNRNDQLIYNDIGYVFFVNMIINGVWLLIFQTYSGFGMIAGLIEIAMMLATNLNATFLLKFFGVEDPDNVFWGLINEEQATIIILYVATIIYNLASYTEMNPLYGSVFIWVVTAIRSNIVNNKPENTALTANTEYIAIFQAISMTALWSYLGTTAIWGVDDGINRGLFFMD